MKTTLLASLLVLGCCSLIVAFPHEIVDDYFDDIQDFTMRSMTGQRAIKIQDFLTNFMAKYDTKLICLDDVVLEALGPGFANCPANDKQLTRKFKKAKQSGDKCGMFSLFKGQIDSEICQANVCGIVKGSDGLINATRFEWIFSKGHLSDRRHDMKVGSDECANERADEFMAERGNAAVEMYLDGEESCVNHDKSAAEEVGARIRRVFTYNCMKAILKSECLHFIEHALDI